MYWSLLALCYLEVRGVRLPAARSRVPNRVTLDLGMQVLLWTSCLLVSVAAVPIPASCDSHSYLLRETASAAALSSLFSWLGSWLTLAAMLLQGNLKFAQGIEQPALVAFDRIHFEHLELHVKAEHTCLQRNQQLQDLCLQELQPGLNTLSTLRLFNIEVGPFSRWWRRQRCARLDVPVLCPPRRPPRVCPRLTPASRHSLKSSSTGLLERSSATRERAQGLYRVH